MSRPWVYFRLGDYVGMIQPEVAAMMKQEIERISKLVDSDKPTPVLGAIFLNSINTPTESLT
jgi:hypothetical protein